MSATTGPRYLGLSGNMIIMSDNKAAQQNMSKEAACREIAEQWEAAFKEWCTITIIDAVKAPKTTALVKAYRNAFQAGYDAGAKAQREEDAEIVMVALKEAEAIRQGRQ